MSYQEKKSIVTMISSTLILVLYAFIVFQRHQDKIFNDPNDLGFWGAVVLILIPVSIVIQIVIYIIFVIMNKIITNEDGSHFSDERDKSIELRAQRNAGWTFIFGFYLAMLSQVLDMQTWVMIITMVIIGYLGAMLGEITKIYFYRKGI